MKTFITWKSPSLELNCHTNISLSWQILYQKCCARCEVFAHWSNQRLEIGGSHSSVSVQSIPMWATIKKSCKRWLLCRQKSYYTNTAINCTRVMFTLFGSCDRSTWYESLGSGSVSHPSVIAPISASYICVIILPYVNLQWAYMAQSDDLFVSWLNSPHHPHTRFSFSNVLELKLP